MENKSSEFTSVRLTPGEFFDKFTIIIRKSMFDPENYAQQVKEFVEILNSNGYSGELLKLLCELQIANIDIWNLEYDIRRGKEGDLGFVEVGKRALKIREVNSKRISKVNEINKIFGIERKETKFDHVSGENS